MTDTFNFHSKTN